MATLKSPRQDMENLAVKTAILFGYDQDFSINHIICILNSLRVDVCFKNYIPKKYKNDDMMHDSITKNRIIIYTCNLGKETTYYYALCEAFANYILNYDYIENEEFMDSPMWIWNYSGLAYKRDMLALSWSMPADFLKDLINKNPNITTKELSEKLRVSEHLVEQRLKELYID